MVTERPIKVRATQPGVYGQYREAGDEFEIANEKAFSKRWMEKITPEPEKPGKKGE